MKAQEQQYLGEDYEPPKIDDIEDALRMWLTAKLDAKDASERVRLRHGTLTLKMAEHGIERYPYVDDAGKKKQAVAAKEPKMKIVSAPSGSGKRGRKGKKRDDADEDPDKLPPAAETWPEHSDPFGSTRRQLEVKPATVPSTPNGKAKKAK